MPVTGAGRKLTLDEPVSLSQLVQCVKVHLSLPHIRLAKPPAWKEKVVTTVAVCAGSGGKVLGGAAADVYLTGTHAFCLMLLPMSVVMCRRDGPS